MHTHITPLYALAPRAGVSLPLHIKLLIGLVAACVPLNVIGTNPTRPYQQKFVLTAYYSPLPDQCCYIKGGLAADKYLNGEGHTAADGTGVYPGMLAAPPSYEFGTIVDLPGLGTYKIHDRGGAIQELENGAHRLDVWAGHGEEGLARALAFGVQRITGRVYPVGSRQPHVAVDLTDLPAPVERLADYQVNGRDLFAMRARLDERALTAKIMQDHLRELGYLQHESTGYFGEKTQAALAWFIRDFQLNEDPSHMTERTGAYLTAALRRKGTDNPVTDHVEPGASGTQVLQAQRLLRFLGYYQGRTTGQYDDRLAKAILKFQQEHWLVGTAEDPGAGRIGPLTMRALQGAWNRALVAARADRYLDLTRVDDTIREQGRQLEAFLSEGNYGDDVRILQALLAEHGFFPHEEINGNFGTLTKQAVTEYQLDRGLITSRSAEFAGYVGRTTLMALQREQRGKYYNLVRAQGWQAL